MPRCSLMLALQASEVLRLSDKSAFSVSIGKRVLASEFVEGAKIPVYSANVFEPFGFVDELLPSLTDFSVDSVLWGIDGDWQVNTIKAGQAFYPTDHCGVLRVKNGVVEPLYLAWALNEESKRVGFSRNYRASIDRIESLSLRFPPLAVQRALVDKAAELESRIARGKEKAAACAQRKQALLDERLG